MTEDEKFLKQARCDAARWVKSVRETVDAFMDIPADPSRDPDLIIDNSLTDVPHLLQMVRELKAHLEMAETECERLCATQVQPEWIDAAVEEIARVVEPCLPYTWVKQIILRIITTHVQSASSVGSVKKEEGNG